MSPHPLKVLFYWANPLNTEPIDNSEEYRVIEQQVRMAKHRDLIDLRLCPSARPEDLMSRLAQDRPHVLHFSGHGTEAGNLVFCADKRSSKQVSPQLFASAISQYRPQLKLIFLNACDSSVLAKHLSLHVPVVIAMAGKIRDDSAIQFAGAFYSALASDMTVQRAFDYAIGVLRMKGLPGLRIPRLFSDGSPDYPLVWPPVSSLAAPDAGLSPRAASVAIERHNQVLLHLLDDIDAGQSGSGRSHGPIRLSSIYCQRLLGDEQLSGDELISRDDRQEPESETAALNEFSSTKTTFTESVRAFSAHQRKKRPARNTPRVLEAAILAFLTDERARARLVPRGPDAVGYALGVVGEAGHGKSSLLYKICTDLQKSESCQRWLLLSAQDLPIEKDALNLDLKPLLSEDDTAATLRHVLSTLAASNGPAIILIDTLDYLISRVGAEAVVRFILQLRAQDSIVIVTCRPTEFADLERYRKGVFDRKFHLGTYRQSQWDEAIKRHVKIFYPDKNYTERQVLQKRILAMCRSTETPKFRKIFANPLLCRMTFQAFAPGRIPDDLDTRLVYGQYWERKVNSPAIRIHRTVPLAPELTRSAKVSFALDVSRMMLRLGQPSLTNAAAAEALHPAQSRWGAAAVGVAQSDLVSEHVLLPLLRARPIEFFHQTFFEYAAALSVADDHTLGRFRILCDFLAKHTDLVRYPVMIQSVLEMTESRGADPDEVQLDRQRFDEIINNFLGQEKLQDAAFELLAKYRGPVSLSLWRRVDALVSTDPGVRRKFINVVKFLDEGKLASFEETILSIFVCGSFEDKTFLLSQLSISATELPYLVCAMVGRDAFSEQDLQSNSICYYLRDFYTKLAQVSPLQALDLIDKKWLSRHDLPFLCRQFLCGSLAPAAPKQGTKVLQLLMTQAPHTSRHDQRRELCRAAANCSVKELHKSHKMLRASLVSRNFNDAILASMLYARSARDFKIVIAPEMANIFLESDEWLFNQLRPALEALSIETPLEFWGSLDPGELSPQSVKGKQALQLLGQANTLPQPWVHWQLQSLQLARTPTATAAILASLRSHWVGDWKRTITAVQPYLLGAPDKILRGVVTGCVLNPDNRLQVRAILDLFVDISRHGEEGKTFSRIMDKASEGAETVPDEIVRFGVRYLETVLERADTDIVRQSRRIAPLATLLKTLAAHHPDKALSLAETIQKIEPKAADSETIKEAQAQVYAALAPIEPEKVLRWLELTVHQPHMPAPVSDMAASALVLVMKATSDVLSIKRVAALVPRLANRSAECGSKMTWACTYMAMRGDPEQALVLLWTFAESLKTRGRFSVRDAIADIASAGGKAVVDSILQKLPHLSLEIQLAVVEGLAKSSYKSVLYAEAARQEQAPVVLERIRVLINKNEIQAIHPGNELLDL